MGQTIILSSSMTLTTRKTKYSKNISKPRLLLILHLQAAMDMMTNSSMRKRRTMAQNRPLLLTSTGFKSLIMLKMSQGNGRLEGGQRHRKDNREELGFLGTFLFKNEWLVCSCLLADSPHSDVKDVGAH